MQETLYVYGKAFKVTINIIKNEISVSLNDEVIFEARIFDIRGIFNIIIFPVFKGEWYISKPISADSHDYILYHNENFRLASKDEVEEIILQSVEARIKIGIIKNRKKIILKYD